MFYTTGSDKVELNLRGFMIKIALNLTPKGPTTLKILESKSNHVTKSDLVRKFRTMLSYDYTMRFIGYDSIQTQ